MGTADRTGAPGAGDTTQEAARVAPQGPHRSGAAAGRRPEGRSPRAAEERTGAGARSSVRSEPVRAGDGSPEGYEMEEERVHYRPLWIEEPARRRRLPDPVRTSAVRAVLVISVTLIQAVVAFLCTVTGSWLAFPMVLSSVACTVVATWAALDVWVTRQVWNQRHGVVSEPSSTARALRRERRKARRHARVAARSRGRIRGRSAAGQPAHP
ncbi:hypothetical protein ACGFS9_06835 [Streptomyces sp. NPDC048566]|uniref:hypothetical protein n=1 Tax=Streptomyces sp. NPDC048566 TaxID=3365569 RepID=UPI003711AC37